jgi:hypothetical protein
VRKFSMFSNQISISGIVPNNCDEDIPEIYDEVRRGPLRIEDVPRSILERTEDYVIINKPVIITFLIFSYH